ncbi:MAG: hypothetical protein ABW042_01935 [Phenylobacterium sp.]
MAGEALTWSGYATHALFPGRAYGAFLQPQPNPPAPRLPAAPSEPAAQPAARDDRDERRPLAGWLALGVMGSAAVALALGVALTRSGRETPADGRTVATAAPPAAAPRLSAALAPARTAPQISTASPLAPQVTRTARAGGQAVTRSPTDRSRLWFGPAVAPAAAPPVAQIPPEDAVPAPGEAAEPTSVAAPPLVVRGVGEQELLGSDDAAARGEPSDVPERMSSALSGAAPRRR